MTRQKIPFPSLDTPAILVDLDKLESNINAMARMTAEAGIKLRPHTKVHKSTYVAKLQLKAGACGLSVSKLSEAAVYADAGITNIMIVHPFYGDHKLAALKNLLPKADISCVIDGIEGAEAISQVGLAGGRKLPVLLKIDTGLKRFGVLPGEPTLRMARELHRIPGVELVGILSHEPSFAEDSAEGVARLAFENASVMAATARMLREDGIPIEHVATGCSPTSRAVCRYAPYFPEITELHPGAYALGDLQYARAFAMTEDTCAATVLVTVVSTPSRNRACVDGGRKTLSADTLVPRVNRATGSGPAKPVYGFVKGRPDITVARLSEEVGILALSDLGESLTVGDRLEILPVHVSLAVNLRDTLYGVRNGVVEREIPVECRGMDY